MAIETEWSVSRTGDVLLAIAGPLDAVPCSSYLSAFGKLHLRTQGGVEHVLSPGRSVTLAIRRRSDILVAEMTDDAQRARVTRISSRVVPDAPGISP